MTGRFDHIGRFFFSFLVSKKKNDSGFPKIAAVATKTKKTTTTEIDTSLSGRNQLNNRKKRMKKTDIHTHTHNIDNPYMFSTSGLGQF